MALPASGPISMSQVRTELQNDGKTTDLSLTFLGSMSGSGANRTSGYVPINQSSLIKPSSLLPASLSEWYSYDHTTNKACGNPLNPIVGAYYSYVRYEITGVVGSTSTTQLNMPTNPGNTVKCHIYTGSYPFTNLGTLTGTPVFNGTFTTSGSQFYSFDLTSTSHILHIIAWDETIPAGNYQFNISPSCGTTSTTTTIPPVTFTTSASCNGSTIDILVNNFAGGTGTYSFIASGSSESAVNLNLGGPPGGTRYTITGPSYTFTGLPQSTTVWIGVQDSGGNRGIVSVNTPSCTTTTTTTTSTTTTTTTAATRTVRLYGLRNGSLGTSYLYYKVNSGGTILGGYTLTTTGTQYATITVNSGDTVYVYTSPDAGSPVSYHYDCAQIATNTYCTTYTCLGSTGKSFTITADTDISVRSNPASGTC